MIPALGSAIPPSVRRSVVLPAPLRPTSPTRSPARTVNPAPSTTRVPPISTVRPRTLNMAAHPDSLPRPFHTGFHGVSTDIPPPRAHPAVRAAPNQCRYVARARPPRPAPDPLRRPPDRPAVAGRPDRRRPGHRGRRRPPGCARRAVPALRRRGVGRGPPRVQRPGAGRGREPDRVRRPVAAARPLRPGPGQAAAVARSPGPRPRRGRRAVRGGTGPAPGAGGPAGPDLPARRRGRGPRGRPARRRAPGGRAARPGRAQRHRARLLRRQHLPGDRRAARRPGGHGQDPHPPGPGGPAPGAGGGGGEPVNPCAHHHPIAELAAYALDALDDPGERRAIEGHLAHCPLCRAELAAHEQVLAELVDDEAPPASLWGGIAERVAGPAAVAVVSTQLTSPPPRAHGPGISRPRALPAPARPPAGRPPVPSRGARRPRWLGLAAAAVALVVAAAAAPLLAARRDHHPARGPGAEVAAVIRDPRGDDLARVVERGGATYVVVDRRPPLPAGRTYQLWS